MMPASQMKKRHGGTPLEVLAAAGRLGITSFGGPIAHLGYFHAEYVVRRKWLDEQSYADLVALCQMIPGPASSQLGIAIGIHRAGVLGGLAAWIGFTLPSAVALVAFALLAHGSGISAGWLHGLMVVAVAVVAQAVWTMARAMASDAPRATIAFAAAIVGILLPVLADTGLHHRRGRSCRTGLSQVTRGGGAVRSASFEGISRAAAFSCLAAFAVILLGLPALRAVTHSQFVAVVDSFYRSGSLVFGGGHVVLPLLQREVVPPGWVSDATFLSGYGAAQAVPGPLFTFAAYLGAVLGPAPKGVLGAGSLSWPSISRPSSSSSGCFHSMARFEPGGRCAAPSQGSTPPLWGYCSPRSTRRSGRARSEPCGFCARARGIPAAHGLESEAVDHRRRGRDCGGSAQALPLVGVRHLHGGAGHDNPATRDALEPFPCLEYVVGGVAGLRDVETPRNAGEQDWTARKKASPCMTAHGHSWPGGAAVSLAGDATVPFLFRFPSRLFMVRR